MQEVTIICQTGHLQPLINGLEREFGILDYLKDRGHSAKGQQGYLVLEWDGEIEPDFETFLKGDDRVLDYCVFPRSSLPGMWCTVSIPVAVA